VTERLVEALAGIERWPVDHAAAGVLAAGGDVVTHGPVDRVFPLASVTKLLTAAAVLVAAEEESISLGESAGPEGSTVRHLLAHASGLGPEADDPVRAVGTRRIYSNAGYGALGDLVATRAGMAFGDYVREAITAPLGMADTSLEGSPAHGGSSTVGDLLALASELLTPGRLLADETVTEATTAFLPDLAGVLPGYGQQDPNPWGLGPEIRGAKAPHWTPTGSSPGTYGHFGQSGAMLWIDPDAGLALVALADRPFGPWAADAWPALGAAVLP
jgi:CubicO group peptidase (beta-lactamase class C family)